MKVLLLIAASLLGIIAYIVYYKDHKFSSVKPSRISWIIWSLAMGVETLTYSFVSEDLFKSGYFIVSTVACILLTVKILFHSKWEKPGLMDLMCLGFSLFALFAWAISSSPWIGHIISLIAVPIGFIPTYTNAYKHYRREASMAWALWTISDLLVIILILQRLESYQELPYALIEFVSHIGILAIIGFGYFAPLKKIVEVKNNLLGKGVYARISFEEGETILRFSGKLHTLNEVKDKLGGPEDHYLQIGKNSFLGPSGDADDYVNHSCNPNAGLVFSKNKVFLVALRQINQGTEITFDYSTCVLHEGNQLKCLCMEHNCRGHVSGFDELDENLKKKYLDMGIVAPFIYKSEQEKPKKKQYKATIPAINQLKNGLNPV